MSENAVDGLSLDVDSVGDRAVVSVGGTLDARAASLFAAVLEAVVESGCRQLVVDVGGVAFIDAGAVRFLARLAQRMGEETRVLTLRSASEHVQRALDVAGASDLVGDVDTASTTPTPRTPDVEGEALPSDGESRVPDLAAWGANLRPRSSTATVDAALGLVTALAQTTVENADGVSVTLERHGRVMTVAASDDAVKEMDRHQYDTGEGPCLAAKTEGRWFYIESLTDETRWPTFVPLALEQGIHSILSSPLMTKDRPQGALNIYSSTEHAFGSRQQELAALFAEQASDILTTAEPDETDEQVNQRLASALAERQTIHQAQGVMMERNGLTAEAAVRELHRAARAAGRRVADLATEVVSSIGRVDGET